MNRFDPLAGQKRADLPDVTIFPGKQILKTLQGKLRLGSRMGPEA